MLGIIRPTVRWLVLGLSQDGACIDLYENHSENSLKADLSNDTTVNPPLFSLVNTFKAVFPVSTLDIFSIFARSHQTISDPSTHNSAVTNYSHKKFFLIFLFPRLRSINEKQFFQFFKRFLYIIKKHHFV